MSGAVQEKKQNIVDAGVQSMEELGNAIAALEQTIDSFVGISKQEEIKAPGATPPEICLSEYLRYVPDKANLFFSRITDVNSRLKNMLEA